MPKKKLASDLSVDELRWLLLQKRRSSRQERLEQYRRSGRMVMTPSDLDSPALESWRAGTLVGDDAAMSSTVLEAAGEQKKPHSGVRRFLDGLLLLIEVGAVVGFLFILFNGVNIMRRLNQEAISVIVQPTLTPTPLIAAIILPSGHTPPNSPGGAQFNDAEIPEHLRPLVQSLYNAPLPTPGPEQATRLQIPALHIDAPIVQGDGWEQLKKGVGQHIGSANPGEYGNVVLAAHNDVFGELFRDLDRLRHGDLVIVFTNQRSYTYIVVDTKIVQPTAVDVMSPTTQPTVTLISCYPYLVDNQRIVVIARLQIGG
jgi:sortase A